jgi:hypothetical protein
MLVAGCVGMPLVAQAEDGAAIGVAPSQSSGNYGTSSTTTIEYVAVYLKYQAGDLSMKLTVPYISVTSAGALVSGGVVIARPGARGAAGVGRGGAQTTESGLGDVWLEGRYRMTATNALDILPYAKVKLGTASRAKGLGTGENDYEGGFGFEAIASATVFPFLDAGYRVIGEPTGTTLQNIWIYDVGVTFKLDSKNYLTAIYAGRQAAVPGQPAASDLIVTWGHSVGAAMRVQAYFDKGLSNASPDYAVGVGVESRF